MNVDNICQNSVRKHRQGHLGHYPGAGKMDSTCRNLKIEKFVTKNFEPFKIHMTRFFLYTDRERLVIDTESKRYKDMISSLR